MKLLHRYTKDGLNLLGCYWEENPELKKDCCVVFTHGMFDNILENTFAHVLGEELSENGYGFIFGHNRGYGVINNIIKKDPRTKKQVKKLSGQLLKILVELFMMWSFGLMKLKNSAILK